MTGSTNPRASHKNSRTQQQIRRARRRRSGKYRLRALGVLVLVLVVIVLGLHFNASSPATTSNPSSRMGTTSAVGSLAPRGTFTTTSGQQVSTTSLRGRPALLWFVSTWCSSCQAGTQSMTQNVERLKADGVRVVEIELYRDLGQAGPSISAFGHQLAGAQFANPDWIFATSSLALTRTYDPSSYLDIYYLVNSQGRIVYVNGSPSSTMPSLLSNAAKFA